MHAMVRPIILSAICLSCSTNLEHVTTAAEPILAHVVEFGKEYEA
jgi:hypothetical protein